MFVREDHWVMTKWRESNLCVHQVSVTNLGKKQQPRNKDSHEGEKEIGAKTPLHPPKPWQITEMAQMKALSKDATSRGMGRVEGATMDGEAPRD